VLTGLGLPGTATPGGGSAATGLITNWGQVTAEKTNKRQFDRLVYLLQRLIPKNPLADEGTPEGIETIDMSRATQLAGYIVDWIDTPNNGEVGYYNLDQAEGACPDDGLPYVAKNRPMDSIEELSQICGFRQLPHTVILKLAEHITVYLVKTNINTATKEVLHAFYAEMTRQANEEDSANIYKKLHPSSEEEAPQPIKNTNEYGNVIADNTIIAEFRNQTDIKSTIFQVDVYGVTVDPESGKEQARKRIRMIILRDAGLQPIYYRED
jgi:hypothetical protein